MKLPLSQPPKRICLLRLSAIGDISHTLPVVRTLQQAWPETRLTWIIGKTEHALVSDIPGIEFIVFDKHRGWRALLELRRSIQGRHFDVLLHMQMSLRASLISLLVRAPIKLGFDRARAKDLQWWFCNRHIAAKQREHVLESLFGFSEALGINERTLRWDIPIPADAEAFAEAHLPKGRLLVITPCSSMAYRNWHSQGYAEVAVHAARQHGFRIVLCGGNTTIERQYGAEIHARLDTAGLGSCITNLISRTTLKQLLAVLRRADLVLSPDSGPAHLATAVGTPVLGLYACTNPARARPYLSPDLLVDHYPEALQHFLGKRPDEVSWGTRIKNPQAMALITPREVIAKFDNWLGTSRN